MKRITFYAAMLSLCILAVSCNDSKDSSTSTATETTITDSSAAMQDHMNADTASMANNFIMEAAKGGLMEVELGKIAQENAASKDVKNFGAMMVKDHTAANDELKQVAAQKNVSLPVDLGEHKAHVDEMKAMKGADFDKAYVDMMVGDHQKDIAAFEAAANGTDAAVSAFATKTLPVLRKHMEAIKTIQAKMPK